jgi:hypothetical protein
VIAGSALGNSFVAGRMTVAAANKSWIPRMLGTVGHVGPFRVTKAGEDEDTSNAIDKGESPINALILNTTLSAVYILLGNMRILLTLNGLAEYAFFFLTVLGAIILRVREPDLPRPVKPIILIPDKWLRCRSRSRLRAGASSSSGRHLGCRRHILLRATMAVTAKRAVNDPNKRESSRMFKYMWR